MLTEFKKFIVRGNVVDLAVGVIMGAAFGTVVTALVTDLLTPLISAIAKVPDMSDLYFSINGSKFAYGHLLNTLISFLLVSISVFFFIVKPINIINSKLSKKEPEVINSKKCNECASEIPAEAKRCKYCSQAL